MQERVALVPGPIGPLRIAFTDRGAAGAGRVVVCVHGLTRQGRDFDALASALSARARVLAPDMPGRGRSAWLLDPAEYALPVYARLLTAFLRELGLREVDWVGTSMGGLIGMLLAASEAGPIRRLVLNDIGPFISATAQAGIAAYVGRDPRFADQAALEAHLRAIHEGFGPLDDAGWRHLARHSACRFADGTLGLAYDPAIGAAFLAAPPADLDLFELWDSIRCPTLVLRGARSPLLLPETASEMTRRGPRARVVEIEGAGHAPALASAAEIALIEGFLLDEG